MTGPSPLETLRARPRRFRFDAAVRLLWLAARTADPSDAMRFRSPVGLAYPAADVLAVEPGRPGGPPIVSETVMGLAGPAGVLPRWYSEMVVATVRGRSRALADFLDMLGQRFVALFARAGVKYRLHRAAELAPLAEPEGRDRVGEAALAFAGFATPGLVGRQAAGREALLHYSGLLASRPRSAERLEALASDWLGRKVEVVQFAGAWLAVSPDNQSRMPRGRLPGAFHRLGFDAAVGTRAWDMQARIVLRIGPLDLASFQALLPDRAGLRRLVALVRAFLGLETGFAVNLVLAGAEVPPLRLSATADPPPRLGWNSWVPDPGPRPAGALARRDAAEALFEAEIVEAAEAAQAQANAQANAQAQARAQGAAVAQQRAEGVR